MIPGMNPRQMKQAMKRLGIEQQELDDAIAVIIRTKSKDIIIRQPQVSRVNMMGVWTYQISGDEETRELEEDIEIPEEDINTVMEQTGSNKEEALRALKDKKGDIAEAIVSLTK
jgi:nascent polypeptide-associated complex subunit alpha